MDGILNVATQQQSHMGTTELQADSLQQVEKVEPKSVTKAIKEEASTTETKINSKEEVEELVEQLNQAMEPMSTKLEFGVDDQDVFYVSVIEADSGKVIKRFPAEEAASLLPKMQEVSGMLFDSRG